MASWSAHSLLDHDRHRAAPPVRSDLPYIYQGHTPQPRRRLPAPALATRVERAALGRRLERRPAAATHAAESAVLGAELSDQPATGQGPDNRGPYAAYGRAHDDPLATLDARRSGLGLAATRTTGTNGQHPRGPNWRNWSFPKIAEPGRDAGPAPQAPRWRARTPVRCRLVWTSRSQGQ
jgi:hypothetical protein